MTLQPALPLTTSSSQPPVNSKVPGNPARISGAWNQLLADALVQSALRLGIQMSRAEEHRRHAAECLRVAQRVSDPNDKALLIQMAERWRELAEKVQANGATERSE
jgi:hypothetical protein